MSAKRVFPRAFIVHGWAGLPAEAWRPWLRRELQEIGFQVHMPAMPDTFHPQLRQWLDHLSASIGHADDRTVLIGHSLGVPTILRYLAALPDGQKVAGTVLVAAFFEDLGEGFEEIKNFVTDSYDWSKIRAHMGACTILHSSDDPRVPVAFAERLKEKLPEAELQILSGRKHFSHDDGCLELPEALAAIQNMNVQSTIVGDSPGS